MGNPEAFSSLLGSHVIQFILHFIVQVLKCLVASGCLRLAVNMPMRGSLLGMLEMLNSEAHPTSSATFQHGSIVLGEVRVMHLFSDSELCLSSHHCGSGSALMLQRPLPVCGSLLRIFTCASSMGLVTFQKRETNMCQQRK